MKISIITVCKNSGERIKKTIESISLQTYKDIEHIVIDGASTDGTVEWLSKLAEMNSESVKSEQDNHFTTHNLQLTRSHNYQSTFHYISEPDTGIYNAMNKGISISKGSYLLFLNAGDYLYDKGVVKDVVEIIKGDEFQNDIYFGDIITEDPETGNRYRAPNRLIGINSVKLFFWSVPHAASFISKDLLEKTAGYDESYRISGDYDFFIKTLQNEIAGYKYFYRAVSVFLNDGISSDPKWSELLKHENLCIIKKYYGNLPKFLYSCNPLLVFFRFIYKLWLKFEKNS